MRLHESLQSAWAVSISPDVAVLLASGQPFEPSALQYAADPENHPQLIDLPGGIQYGKRPLGSSTERTTSSEPPQHVTEFFVGKIAWSGEERLPSPFLSYAKKVHIPTSAAGKSVFLTLDHARYHVTLVVNGRQVTQYVGGLEPHRIAITDYVAPGEDAMIVITVGDVGVSANRPFDPYNFTGTRLPTCKEIENNLVHPVHYGGADRAIGSVTLDIVSPVHTDYIFANPKVSKGLLQYSVALVNGTDQDVTVQLFSEAVSAKVLLDESVILPANCTQIIRREIPWSDPILWDIDNPHLYDLHTVLAIDGEVIDEHTDYFGFREFSINGHSFYLNGKKIHLFNQSGHILNYHNTFCLQEKIDFFKAWKAEGNVTHARLHARVADRSWVEAADRAGLLLTTETALWTTGYHSFDWAGSEEACYQHLRTHFLEALVRRDRNSPSVILWSLTNEMSPITPFDLDNNPKMQALTRILKRIIDETEAEDDSRVVQMSSAMDFLGNLKMYNLHYPKNWQAFPDYPHTAYWLDSSFLFPWFGPKRDLLPSWSWRKDKPLVFGEFTCVFGSTPDCESSIVGDVAFEQADYGMAMVNAKLWPMEVNAYRRLDVSGFCAWAAMFGNDYHDVAAWMSLPGNAELSYAQRPLAVLDHSYRTKYFAGDEVALELSIHNDSRCEKTLSLRCEVFEGEMLVWTETKPAAVYAPGESLAFTSRFRAPRVDTTTELVYGIELMAGETTVDSWQKTMTIHPRIASASLPVDCAFYDPDGILAAVLAERGLSGGTFLRELDPVSDLSAFRTLWLNFNEAKLREGDWRQVRHAVERFVEQGGCVVLDQATIALQDLPIEVKDATGYAPGGRLEITYAYNAAPHHPLMQQFTNEDFSLWGEDYYVAHRCLDKPQSGNAIPLLVAGTDRVGLTNTPLLEIRYGQGAYLVSTLELFAKLGEAPIVVDVIASLAGYHPAVNTRVTGVCAGADSWRCYQEVGIEAENVSWQAALASDIALIDGTCLPIEALSALQPALDAGKTVYLHALSEEQSQQVLNALSLPGEVTKGDMAPNDWDIVRHSHRLMDGVTNNNLFWIIEKKKLAAWTTATLHPKPTTACIQLVDGEQGISLTKRGAVVAYQVGQGTLVIDNLRWQMDEIEEPERPRRYLTCLLTNMGVGLTKGVAQRMSRDYETAAERRERGHF